MREKDKKIFFQQLFVGKQTCKKRPTFIKINHPPVLSPPSSQAGPFGTTDLIWRNSSTESSPPTMVKPRPRDDLTSWHLNRSPRSWEGSRVKNGAAKEKREK